MSAIRSETEILASRACDERSPAQVAREFRTLVDAGMTLRVAGAARARPKRLLAAGYAPRFRFELFGSRFYISTIRQNPELRFCVAWVVPPPRRGQGLEAFARIFYKDVSLIWRSASHVVRSANENWIGQGDVVEVMRDGCCYLESNEATTDLPLEMQDALETLARRPGVIRRDHIALSRVLRNGPDNRVVAYRDFTGPRERAASNPRLRINGGKQVAWFAHAGDPSSLRFAPGYEPDLSNGVLEETRSESTLYGGVLRRFRILSTNAKLQYLFFAGPHHVWIIPPQATSTELMSYGVRTVNVAVDDDLCVPGYEYHYLDYSVTPPVMVSQIPAGLILPLVTPPATAPLFMVPPMLTVNLE